MCFMILILLRYVFFAFRFQKLLMILNNKFNNLQEALMSDCVFVYVEVIKRIVGERNASKRVEELYLNKNFENNVAHRMLFNALGKG